MDKQPLPPPSFTMPQLGLKYPAVTAMNYHNLPKEVFPIQKTVRRFYKLLMGSILYSWSRRPCVDHAKALNVWLDFSNSQQGPGLNYITMIENQKMDYWLNIFHQFVSVVS
ncbi:hypothetical protein AMECASPLE_009038 [Ameca splendens]|uniref:Uncharacterized protein n=1 Tax=Ameca splendens TaxID=208324 RepID=A0ABV0YXZ9_9TELE